MTGRDQPFAGEIVGREHRLPLRVYVEDADLSGVVYHANYLRYMERGRSDMLRLAGVDQRAAVDAGEGMFAVASLSIRYRAPARLGDALLVTTRVTGVRAAALSMAHRISRDGATLAEAEGVAALVAPGGRPRRLPRDWAAIFTALIEEGRSAA